MSAHGRNTLWGLITLKPFGNFLCTSGARAWLLAATIAVAIMATSEALAWGYMGYWFATGPVRYAIAGFLGLLVLLMIAIVDSQFLTFDLHPERYEISKAKGGVDDSPKSFWRDLYRGVVSLWNGPVPGFIVRIVMVVGSLVISSPYLTSAVLAPDVTAQIERQRNAVVEASAEKIGASYVTRSAAIQAEMDHLRLTSIDEAAGTGPSRKRGRGPAVKTVEARLRELGDEVAALGQQKKTDVDTFRRSAEAAASNKDAPNQGGMQERAAALELLKRSPGYLESQRPIKAYLIGVFLTIVVLKAFQRRSVSIYFSERLQDAHEEYLEGRFDEWVSNGVRSTDEHRMAPLDFEDWYLTSHKARVQQRELEAQMGTVKDRQVTFARVLDDRSETALKELEPLYSALEQVEEELVKVEDNLAATNADITSLETVLAANRTWIGEMDSNLLVLNRQNTTAQAVGADVYVGALRSRSYYVEKVAEMDGELKDALTKRSILKRDHEALERERQRHGAELDQKRDYLAAAHRARNEARLDELRQVDDLRKRYDPRT
jgi:hypothetical protein